MNTALFRHPDVGSEYTGISSQSIFLPNTSRGTNVVLGFTLVGMLGIATLGTPNVATVNAGTGTIDQKVFVVSAGKIGGQSDINAIKSGDDWIADLQWVKSHADVSMSALAEFFGVTRKTLYDWFEGSEPRKSRLAIISAVRNALDTLPSREHRTAFFELAERRLASGETLRAIFSSSSEDDSSLLDRVTNALVELDENMEKAVHRLQRRGGRSRQFESEFRAT